MSAREPASITNRCMQKIDIQIHMDTILTNHIAHCMKHALRKSRAKGRHSWWNSYKCSMQELTDQLDKKYKQKDYIAIICLSAMVLVRLKMEEIK